MLFILRKLKILSISFLSLLFNSCSLGGSHKMLLGIYKEQEVYLFSKERKTFVSNVITYSLQLGKHPRITFDYNLLNADGVPYDDSIFGNTKQVRFSTYDSLQYQAGSVDTKNPFPNHNYMMMYIDPEYMDKASFEAYADFFENEWEKLRAEHNKDYKYLVYDIIGMIYGNKKEFTQYFFGKLDGRDWYFKIDPNGAIEFWDGTPENSSSSQGTGLSNKVIMPGRKLIFQDGNAMSYAQLLAFKDKKGKSIADYFNIEKVDYKALLEVERQKTEKLLARKWYIDRIIILQKANKFKVKEHIVSFNTDHTYSIESDGKITEKGTWNFPDVYLIELKTNEGKQRKWSVDIINKQYLDVNEYDIDAAGNRQKINMKILEPDSASAKP